MGLFKEAIVEQAAAKIGIFGRQATGKSTTAAMLAIGFSLTYHKGAPVAFLDTENGSDYLVPLFNLEGVKLLVIKSRSFADMRTGIAEAAALGCCAYIVDSYTHPWIELCDTFKAKSRRKKLEFHHMDALKSMWRTWTDEMLNSPLHVVLCGRLGYDWGEEEDEDGGEKKLVKLGTKMKSESEAGYEPSLLMEIEAIQPSNISASKRAKRGTITHRINVVKDRWRTLNGRAFDFADINSYKQGDWKKVFETFLPHWSQLAIGSVQRATDPTRTSAGMFGDDGQANGAQWQRRRDIAAEEIAGIIGFHFTGQDADSKKKRNAITFELFDTHSWKAVESMSVDRLEEAVSVLKAFSTALKAGGTPEDVDGVLKTLRDARTFYGEAKAAQMEREREESERAAEIKAEDDAAIAAGAAAF